MDGRLRDGEVIIGGDAREQFYDSRGYGRPLGDGLVLAPVEAAHLLYRGDLDAVLVGPSTGGDRLDFQEFVAAGASGFVHRFLVYKDLRDRGFYLSPTPPPETTSDVTPEAGPDPVPDRGIGAARGPAERPSVAVCDFEVYPRGKGPWDDAIAYRVRAIGERQPTPADSLGGIVLAVVDEEGELTYLLSEILDPTGTATVDSPSASGQLLEDAVLVWDSPTALHEQGFYGQPFDAQNQGTAVLQLSLVEAADLAARGSLTLRGADGAEGAVDSVIAAGRRVEGDRFDRRLRAYRALRDAGLVPKTGFKFGADFRVYQDFQDLDSLSHSEYLVRVLDPDHVFAPRDLALDVRLAGGVRKRMLFARDHEAEIEWLAVDRLTP